MRVSRSLPALFVLVGSASCSEANQQNYAQAAVLTGVAVATVGVYRAITHDCWARCTPGYLCNEESGLCEFGECLPGCEVGWHCVRDVRGMHYCVHDATGAATRSSLHTNTAAAPDGGVATDAGATDAASSSAADAAADATTDAALSAP